MTAAAHPLMKAFLPPGGTVVAVGPEHAARSLDLRLAEDGIRHVDWLTLGAADAPIALEGAADLLRLRRVDFILFDPAPASERLAAAHALLSEYGYALFRFANRNLEHLPRPPDAADGRPAVFLAVAPRHWKRLFARDHSMFRFADLFRRHGVTPRGIIHVGAHEGAEYENYVEAGCRRVVFIEADPATSAVLAQRFAGVDDVLCIGCAVADASGTAEFTRMSGDQCNSLLRPRKHLEIYPHITPREVIQVETAPLPAILAAHGVSPADYNVLVIDAQGAETRILRGCRDLLSGFDAVTTEVNWAELYEGCGLIAEVDDILFAAGFERVEEISPHHHSWGDAFYRRRR